MKRFLYVLAGLAVVAVIVMFAFRAEELDQDIIDRYETDTEQDSTENNLVDSLIDNITNDPEFDFDFEEEEESDSI